MRFFFRRLRLLAKSDESNSYAVENWLTRTRSRLITSQIRGRHTTITVTLFYCIVLVLTRVCARSFLFPTRRQLDISLKRSSPCEICYDIDSTTNNDIKRVQEIIICDKCTIAVAQTYFK